MDTATPVTPSVDLAAARRALARKLAINITTGIAVTVVSSLLITAIDRKFNSVDSTEND